MDLGSLLGGPKHVQKQQKPNRKPGPSYLVRYVKDGSQLQNDERPEIVKPQEAKELAQEPAKEPKKQAREAKQKDTGTADASSQATALTESQLVADIAKKSCSVACVSHPYFVALTVTL